MTKTKKQISILDDTKHFSEVKLDPDSYNPPLFSKNCPNGISPFVPEKERRKIIEELKRKLNHMQKEAVLKKCKKEGLVMKDEEEKKYTTDLMKRNILKKQMKTKHCEVCRVNLDKFEEHISSSSHMTAIHSHNYFGFFNAIFNRLFLSAWKKYMKEKSLLWSPASDDEAQSFSNCFWDYSLDDKHSNHVNSSNELCYLASRSRKEWLFPQFYGFTSTNWSIPCLTKLGVLNRVIMKPLFFPASEKKVEVELLERTGVELMTVAVPIRTERKSEIKKCIYDKNQLNPIQSIS